MLEGDCLLAHYIFVSLIVDPRGGKVIILESFVKSTIEILLSLLDRSAPTSHPWGFSADVGQKGRVKADGFH